MPRKRKGKGPARSTRTLGGIGKRSGSASVFPTEQRYTVCRLTRGQIMPSKLIAPLKYAETRSQNVAGAGVYFYSQNSVYDPNVTGTGSSCNGFNTLMSLYWRYRVIATKFRFSVQTDLTTPPVTATAAFLTSNSGISQPLEITKARWAKPRNALRYLSANGAGPSVVLEDEINTSDIAGVALYDDEEMFGDAGSDPVNQFYIGFGWDATTPSGSVLWTFEVEYLTEFTEVRDIIT